MTADALSRLAPSRDMETTAEERTALNERCRFTVWCDPETALLLLAFLRDFDRLDARVATLEAALQEARTWLGNHLTVQRIVDAALAPKEPTP